jgi:hypothetical protein
MGSCSSARGLTAPLAGKSLRATLKQMGAAVTVHGFRSSFRSWTAAQTSYPEWVCEMSLAHQVGDAVLRAYQRSDVIEKRRRLMTAWANFCCGETASADASHRVVPLRKS